MKKNISKVFAIILALTMLISVFSVSLTANAATLIWPVPGHTSLSQGFHSGHPAIDINDGSINGATVVAAMGGTVEKRYLCGSQHYGSMGDCGGFGTGIIIRGDDGRWYQYAHMQANSIPSNVYLGAYVSAGQKVGCVGTTGNSSGAHLHFQINTTNAWNGGVNPSNETYNYGGSSSSSYFTDLWVEGITKTDATIYATTNLTYVQRTGFYIGTSTSNMTRKIEDTYANVLKAWFTMSDCGVTLSPGTKYYYKIFIIVNGQEYCTEAKSFTTKSETYTVSYNANGGSGAPSSQTKTTGQSIALSSTKPIRSGYTFKCWNTKADGTGTNYYPGGTYSANANVTLYAQWTANKKNFKVTYNANGGSSIIPYEYVEEGKTVALTTPFKNFKITYNANGGSNAPSATNVSVNCLGWSLSSTATTATYTCGSSYKPTSDVTLYAVWEKTGTVNLDSGTPTRDGYYFLGWSEDPNATKADFAPDETVNASGNATLYAVWGTEPANTGYTWWEWIIIIVFFGWIWYV